MIPSTPAAERPSRNADFAASALLFALSMATVTGQVVQTRIFSDAIAPSLGYVIISIALMGFGIGGTLIALLPALRKINLRLALAGSLLLFGLSLLAANGIFAHFSAGVHPRGNLSLLSPWLLLFSAFVLPFVFSGTGVALALLSNKDRIGRNYFITLVGSGLGCFAVYPFSWLGDPVHIYAANAGSPVGLSRLTVELSLLSLLIILAPLLAIRKRKQSLKETLPLAAYFFSIGIGFMAIEIGMMQAFSLFLGNPQYSISAILFSVMVFSGLGSLYAERSNIGVPAAINIGIAGIVICVMAFYFLSDALLARTADGSVAMRMAIAVAAIAPMSFFMGIPFPTFFKVVEQRSRQFSPWAFGVNGFASVLASLASMCMAVAERSSSILVYAAAAYLLALVSFHLHRLLFSE